MKLKISASIVSFAKRAKETWGLEDWLGITDPDKDLLFFGLYNDRDWAVFDTFGGNPFVLWAGTDILQLLSDYERKRILKNHPEAKHYCENELEATELRGLGLEVEVIPSFLDNINNYPITYKHTKTPHIYIAGKNEREEEYGLGVVRRIADRVPDATFHVYGIDKNSSYFTSVPSGLDKLVDIDSDHPNVWYHGKVEEGQFNNEITQYQCGLRTNEHDGFSEITAKSLLMGQYPINKIPYEKVWSYTTDDELVALIEKLKFMTEPNLEARSHYIKKFNNYPWCPRKYHESNK